MIAQSSVLIAQSLLLGSAHNEFIRALVITSLVTARGLSPGRYRMATARSLALASAVRMVNGVHRDAANFRATTNPSGAARFAEAYVAVLDVSDLAYGGVALNVDAANLA